MKLNRIWSVSLVVLGIAVVLLGVFRLLWAGVPDAVVRVLGIALLIALPVFAYATVRLAGDKKRKQ